VITAWPNFVPDILRNEVDPGPGTSRPILVPPFENGRFPLASESDVEHSFTTAIACINQLYTDIRTVLFPRVKIKHENGLSFPDFATVRVSLDGEATILAVGEAKTPTLVRNGDDLVALHDTDGYVKDAIYQLCGYHVKYKVKYELLTCYTHTWAACLIEDGTLWISPPFLNETEGRLSVLRMMQYVVHMTNAQTPWLAPDLPLV
jgi:hypothetical protein